MALVTRIIAPNPGPYTGPGTNTWIVDAGPVVVVIDPGPDDDSHLASLNERLAQRAVGVVLVTHSHPDHLPLAQRFAEQHRASVRRHPDLRDGDITASDGTRHDDWKSIIRNGIWGMLYILSFLGFVFVLLFCLSTLLPMWTE